MPDTAAAFRKIMVATDFSEDSRSAIDQAVTLADRTGAELILVHAVDYRPYAVYGSSFEAPWQATGIEIREVEEQLRQRSDEQLAQQVADLRTLERKLYSETLVGVPFVEIIHAAQRHACDLVVVGSRGKGGMRRLLVGSTAERLVRKCPCSVWVVRPESQTPPKAILVPVDFSEISAKSLGWGTKLSQLFGSPLSVLHVIASLDEVVLPPGTSWRDNRQHRAAVKKEAERHLREYVASRVPPEVTCLAQLAIGTPWQKIGLSAQHLGADLIVLGTVGRTGIPGFLIGNTAEKVLRHCDFSILAIKPEGFVSPVQLEASES